jgi:hypothetical protein
MADQGAAKIKSLLDTPSASLAGLMNTLQNAMSQAQNDNNLTVPTSTFSAINALRNYYRNLGNNVRSISTSSPAKGEVLAALKQLDASLVSLSKALQEGTSDNATGDLTASEQHSAQASTQLARASSALG